MKLLYAFFSSLLALTAILTAESRGSASRGKMLFAQCAGCHSADTYDRKMGPSLKGMFKHSKLGNGKPLTDETVKAQLTEGGKGMPGFAEDLSGRDVDDLLAYLKTL